MKTRLLLAFFLLIVVCYTGISQVPQGFSYQAIATDATNHPIANQTFLVKITLQTTQIGGTTVWEEQQSVTTNPSGLFSMVIGTGTRLAGATAFNQITWSDQAVYLKTTIQYPGSTWTVMGAAQVWSVPFSLVAEKANSVTSGSKLSVVSDDDAATEALFEVKRKDGQIVFAVYPDAVNVNVPNSTAKGAKGGFAIGGFGGTKADPQEYFRVTPDSVRIYIDQTAKGSKGGFAIGGYGGTKGGTNSRFFNLSGSSELLLNGGSAQVLWYPLKNAFLAGNVRIISPDSVGSYSTSLGYWSRAAGNYSQAFGYKAVADGDYSTSIGKRSVAGVKNSRNNAFALGNSTKATGEDSYAFGSGAEATGEKSFALGSIALNDAGYPVETKPTTAAGPYSVAIGMGAQAIGKGDMALGVGAIADGYFSNSFGYYSTSSNKYSTALGFRSIASGSTSTAVGSSSRADGDYASAFGRSAAASGVSSVAIGYGAITGTLATDASSFGKSANASGISSMALGTSSASSGNTSVAIGYNSQAVGDYSFAIGTYGLNADGTVNTARPTKTFLSYSVALGMGAQANLKGDMAFGVNSTAQGGYSTSIGYGPTASGQYSTAIGYAATSIGVGSMAAGYNSNSGGNYSTAIGFGSISPGINATGIGYYSKANGNKSLAIGSQYNYTYYRFVLNKFTGQYTLMPYTVNKYNVADGDFSVAVGNGNQSTDGGITLGSNNTAIGSGAVSIGHSNTANSPNSFAGGYGNNITGYNAIAMGESLTAQSVNSFVVGTYNTLSGSTTQWIATDPLFVVGNGDATTRHDALVVTKDGNLYVPGIPEGSGGYWLQILASGQIVKTVSSMKYKHDINSLSNYSWLYDLRPVDYLFNSVIEGPRQYGLIAEEVDKVNKELVIYKDGEPDAVNYMGLIAPLIKAVQDQKKTIESLQSDNEALKQRLEKLELLVNSIK